MPIDVSIYRNLQPAPVQNPLTMLSELVQARRGIAELRKEQREEADQTAIRQVLADAGGNIEEALPQLRKIAPAAALKFETELGVQRKNQFDALRSQTELEGKRLDVGLRYLQGVKDDRTFQIARRVIQGMVPQVAEMLGETYDPARVQQIREIGLSAKDHNDARRQALELFTKGDAAKAVGTWLSTVANEDEWNGTLQTAEGLGVPPSLLQQFGTFSPENVNRARAIATPGSDAGFTLSPGQTRFGPTGQPIANVPGTPGAKAAASRCPPARRATGQAVRWWPRGPRRPPPRARSPRPAPRNARSISSTAPARPTRTSRPSRARSPNSDSSGKVACSGLPTSRSRTPASCTTRRNARSPKRDSAKIRARPSRRTNLRAIARRISRSPVTAKRPCSRRPAREPRSSRVSALSRRCALGEFYGEDAGSMLDELKTRAAPPKPAAPPPAPHNKALTVTAPDGNTYTFKTAAEAAAFKRRARIP